MATRLIMQMHNELPSVRRLGSRARNCRWPRLLRHVPDFRKCYRYRFPRRPLGRQSGTVGAVLSLFGQDCALHLPDHVQFDIPIRNDATRETDSLRLFVCRNMCSAHRPALVPVSAAY